MMIRTPYGCSPYGADRFQRIIGANRFMLRENYAVVYQDVRGRWASEGAFVEMTPHIDIKKGPADHDEASDTYDTIEWLLKNVPNHNSNVGQMGISYGGFFTSAGAVSGHPALKASSPQAPMADLWRDDAFHNGAFMLAANFGFYTYFQAQTQPIKQNPAPLFEINDPDGYHFYLNMGPTANSGSQYYKRRNPYYYENFKHPNYDDHWQKRDILPHLKNIKHAVMVVGGWFDEQDLFGTFNTYKAIETQNPGSQTIFVVGPWYTAAGHRCGQPARPWPTRTLARPYRRIFNNTSKPGSSNTIFSTKPPRWPCPKPHCLKLALTAGARSIPIHLKG